MWTRAFALLALTWSVSADAGPHGAQGFTLINGTTGALGDIAIRHAGANDWKPLGAAPGAGARSPVKFSDPDCAFDIRASVAGGPVTWTGVNLCDAKSVILRKDEAVGPWVDYDQ